MKKLMIALLTTLLATSVWAQSCEEKAVGKNGKPLAGAAREASIKKCERESGNPVMKTDKESCESRAVDKNGKPLHGAAKGAFIKKCNSEQNGK